MATTFNKGLSLRVRGLIARDNLPDFLIAALLEIKPSSFSDLINGKAHWKAEYIKIISEYFGITTDELIFGEKDYIRRHNKTSSVETKEKVRDFLLRNKKFETFGKLTADGYFKEIEEPPTEPKKKQVNTGK